MRNVGRLLLLFTFMATTMPSLGLAANQCRSLFTQEIEKVIVTNHDYSQNVHNLRDTLTGKLATVWRSEWKTKLSVIESNKFVSQMVNTLLTEKTRKKILKGLDVTSDGFTREVHARLYQMQTAGQLQPGDQLSVRDKPSPAGAKDTTYTYYTKPIIAADGLGKHQVRARTYLREIDYSHMEIDEPVVGYGITGKQYTFTRLGTDSFKVQVANEHGIEQEKVLSQSQVEQQFGAHPKFLAPHGKNFKLEIKSALTDQISPEKFTLLGGNHMVQKLDVTMTPTEIGDFFAPSRFVSAKQIGHQASDALKNKTERKNEMLARVEDLRTKLDLKNPENVNRIHSVTQVIDEALQLNPLFLEIEGATTYHRTAFETAGGLQITVDRDQAVYSGNMYTSDSLKNPIFTIQKNIALKTIDSDARHVELKVPVTSMQNTVGITFNNLASAPAPVTTAYDKNSVDMIAVYHRFVKNNLHSGKFNYIRANGATDVD